MRIENCLVASVLCNIPVVDSLASTIWVFIALTTIKSIVWWTLLLGTLFKRLGKVYTWDWNPPHEGGDHYPSDA